MFDVRLENAQVGWLMISLRSPCPNDVHTEDLALDSLHVMLINRDHDTFREGSHGVEVL